MQTGCTDHALRLGCTRGYDARIRSNGYVIRMLWWRSKRLMSRVIYLRREITYTRTNSKVVLYHGYTSYIMEEALRVGIYPYAQFMPNTTPVQSTPYPSLTLLESPR